MKHTIQLLCRWALLAVLSLVGTVHAQYVNVQVYATTLYHYETSACWETGSEEYSALVYANLDGGTWQGGTAFTIDNNGDCSQTISYTPLNTTTLATTVGVRLYAWENDSGSRSTYDSGDDCLTDYSASYTIRDLTRASWTTCSSQGTSNHKITFQIYWNWIAPTAPTIAAASSVAQTSFVANWSAPSNCRVTGYYLTVATDSGFANIVSGYNGLSVGTATFYAVSGLSPNTTYYHRVTAANEAGTGSASDSASATTAQYSQTITFSTPSDTTYGDAPFTLGATASSGLSVSYALVSGPATLSSGTVTITGAGTVTIRASQSGNSSYAAATSVDRSFAVNKAVLICRPADAYMTERGRIPVFTLTYRGFVNGETATVLDTAPTAACAATSTSPHGFYPITCSGGSDDNYSFTCESGTLRIRERATMIRIF